ncbi:MAG TPA: phytanoyl-CoA dioxygenase [Micromonosporaceae bacterium]|nr:phytanoyl-CoA dioxygenase [Micromonosporaceae bacterium]HCU52689.1 phytanoyl-CoA dioxygenase [Micromonosporaceae bacterium]
MQVLSNGVPVTTDSEHFAPMRDSSALLGDPEKLRAQFQQDGYVYLRGVLDREKVMKLRGYYFGMFDASYFQEGTTPEAGIWSGNVPAGQLSHGVAGHPAHTLVRSEPFAEFAGSPELAEVAKALLNEEEVFQLPRQIVRHFNKGPLSSRAHTDFDYMDKGSASIITMWLPIGDCPVQSGGLTYLEGSHQIPKDKLDVLKAKRTDRPGDTRPISHDLDWTAQQLGGRWLYSDYQAGDVAIHSPHLVHASLDTQTEMMRMSVDVRFLPKSVQPDPRWLTPWSGDDGN